MLHREAFVIEDVHTDTRVPPKAFLLKFVRSLAMVPIRQTDPIGAIGVY